MNMPTLRSKRLMLRMLIKNDAHDIFSYASNPEVARYTEWEPHTTIQDSHLFLQECFKRYAKEPPCVWGIEHKKDKKIIGTIGFVKWNSQHKRAELGYALCQTYWGQGLCPKALNEILHYTFTDTPINRIEAFCFLENTRSIKVLLKIDFIFEGTLRKIRFIKGKFTDMNIYSLLREEWEQHKTKKQNSQQKSSNQPQSK